MKEHQFITSNQQGGSASVTSFNTLPELLVELLLSADP
jgi:hypothetical protein